jgi:isocitrate dehydrogenase (NAD+)
MRARWHQDHARSRLTGASAEKCRALRKMSKGTHHMAYQVTLIPGDGIGPEVAEATKRVIEATGVSIEWDTLEAGVTSLEKTGDVLPDSVLESIRANNVALKGPLTTPLGTGFRSVNVALRHELQLYANLRPARTFPGVRSVFTNIDLVVVRENMEDLYAGVEFDTGRDDTRELIETINRLSPRQVSTTAAISIKLITPENSERIVRYAFDYAIRNERKLVTAVHKANIMKFSDGLFLKIAQEVAGEFPQIDFNDRIVDNMCMQLMQRPEDYDVLVMPNLYGDVLSDLTAGMVGGLGVAPSANIGDAAAIFEPIHGSAPSHAGKNEANPSAMILSGAMMLRHLGELSAARAVEAAVASIIEEGVHVTYDLRADRDRTQATSTSAMADAIISRMGA